MNTAIAAIIELNNDIVQRKQIPKELARTMLLLISPFAPHIAEELWSRGEFGSDSAVMEAWPEGDEDLARENTVTVPVQINGKMRAKFEVAVDAPQDEVERLALEQPNVQTHLGGKDPKKVIVVTNRMVNIVV